MGLTVSDFSAGYGTSHPKKEVVADISFTLPDGTLTALIGVNGCGKSTLLKGLCRLIPSSGSVLLQQAAGKPQALTTCSHRALSRIISYIPQRSGLTLSLSALDVVLMGFEPSLRLLEAPGTLQKAAAGRTLELLSIPELAHQDFLTLSEGQKQLVLLARTIVQDTPLLFLDEPDGALDYPNRHLLLHTLQKIVYHKPKAALLILHDLNLALDCCDQLLLMEKGHIVTALHPKQDPEAVLSRELSRLYGPVRVFRQEGHCFLYPLEAAAPGIHSTVGCPCTQD